MDKKIKIFDIQVDEQLLNFVNKEILKDLNIDNTHFWKGFSDLINVFNPLNRGLIDKRFNFQKHTANKSRRRDQKRQRRVFCFGIFRFKTKTSNLIFNAKILHKAV